jgi:hypothetical protein
MERMGVRRERARQRQKTCDASGSHDFSKMICNIRCERFHWLDRPSLS